MFKLLYPDRHLNSIFDLNPDSLLKMGIRGLITDMDNTLVPWNDRNLSPRLGRWFDLFRERGIKFFIISNNSKERGGQIADELGIPALWYAAKPGKKAFKKALQVMQLPPEEVAVVGDQVFTDILGGNRLGLYTILVTPISEKEFIWTKVMRALERIVLGPNRERAGKKS